jgi:hypothetical protein
MCTKFCSENLKGRDLLEDMRRWKDIRMVFREKGCDDVNSSESSWGTIMDPYEHSSETVWFHKRRGNS